MSRSLRRRLLLAGLGLVLTAGAALGAYAYLSRREVTTSSNEALQYYRLGRENERKMYAREALAAYAEALKLDPHFVMATVRLAYLTWDRDPERARALFECARSSAGSITDRERLRLRIFEAGMNAKDPKEVEPLYDEYVRRFPDDPDGYLDRARLFTKTERMPQAISDLEKLLSLNPNYALAYNMLGYYWLSQGNYTKAEEYLRRYRFLAPDQANPNDSLGELYLSIGRYEEAEEFLKKALEVKPDFYASRAHLGTLDVARGRLVEAADQFRTAAEATELVWERREWLWSEALALALAGQNEEAAAAFAKIPPLPPDSDQGRQQIVDLETRLHRALFAALMGRGEEARGLIQPVPGLLDGMPASAKEKAEEDLAAVRGVLAAREGRPDEAAEAFRASIPKGPAADGYGYFPGRDMLRVALAKSLVAAGRPEEAEEALKPVLSRNPKFQPALDALSRIRSGLPAAARS
ncbi:MAG: tetratricopeptide repeat protein [Thermoanaerobaculia bacterium]